MSEIGVFVSNPKPGVFVIREPRTGWDITLNFNLAANTELYAEIPVPESAHDPKIIDQAVYDLYANDVQELKTERKTLDNKLTNLHIGLNRRLLDLEESHGILADRVTAREMLDSIAEVVNDDTELRKAVDVCLVNLERNNEEIKRLQVDVSLLRQSVVAGSGAMLEGLRGV